MTRVFALRSTAHEALVPHIDRVAARSCPIATRCRPMAARLMRLAIAQHGLGSRAKHSLKVRSAILLPRGLLRVSSAHVLNAVILAVVV